MLGDDGAVLTGGAELLGRPGPKWVDVADPDEESLKPIAAQFGLHRLAIEDCLHLDQRPKLEEYKDHLFVVMHGFSALKEDICLLDLHEMHFFLGKDWLLSVHERSVHAVEETKKRIGLEPAQTMGRGVDHVMYMIADTLVDDDFPLLDAFGDEVDDLETKIFGDHVVKASVERIFALKRMLVTLRRVLSPQRDVVGMLARGMPYIQDRTTIYFRDIYDHLIRLYEQIDASRDILGNVMDAHLTMIANRTNDVTKQLTIFASIFLPLSVLVGFFGQNFDQLNKPFFFYAMLAALFLLPVGMFIWFRHKDWI